MGVFRPSNRFYRVTDISPEFLKDHGIKALLLDADNTLSTHHSKTPHKGVPEWLDSMRANGIKLIMVSNSKEKRVKPFADSLGLEYEHTSLKPLQKGIRRAIDRMGVKRKEAALVGDQLLTDVLGARLAGVNMILVRYIEKENKFGFKLKRAIEKVVFAGMKYKGKDEE